MGTLVIGIAVIVLLTVLSGAVVYLALENWDLRSQLNALALIKRATEQRAAMAERQARDRLRQLEYLFGREVTR